MEASTKRPTVREINAHIFGGWNTCYVRFANGRSLRISRARSTKGVLEGRVIIDTFGGRKDWAAIPADAVIELD